MFWPLTAFAVLLQTIELWFVPAWPWKIIEPEIPFAWRGLLSNNRALLVMRFLCALVALLWPHPAVLLVLALTTWGIALRWRGTFNGSSDAMTFYLLLLWCASETWTEHARDFSNFVVVLLVLSYLLAGLSKARRRDWWSGKALQKFFAMYGWSLTKPLAMTFSWAVIAFECTFALAVFHPLPYLAVGVLFHLGNALVFGLNRFFWIWLAAYPALYAIQR